MVSTKSKEPRLVLGVGTNNATYPVSSSADGKRPTCPVYAVWSSMLSRCYSHKLQANRPTYIGCTVVDEWLIFMAFRRWMIEQDWEGKQLDKDLLIPGNKVYGPETCLFVSSRVNTLVTDSGKSRGLLPIGVCLHHGQYMAQCASRTEGRYLGLFDTPEEAHSVYLTEKKKVIEAIASDETNILVKKALLERADRLTT